MMHPMMGGYSGSVPLLLLALAAGYGVLVLANKEQRPLNVLGRWIGALILLISFVGLLCVAVSRLWCRYACSSMPEQCGYGQMMNLPPPPQARPPQQR